MRATPTHTRPRRFFSYIPLLYALVIGCAWTGFLLKWGGMLSVDSLFYLKTAVYMHFNHDYNTIPTVWPPFFPMAISALVPIAGWPATAGSLLSGLSLLGVLVFFCLIQRRTLNHTPMALASLICLSSLTAIWRTYSFVWSETLFGMLVLAHVFFLNEFLRTSKPRHVVFAAGLLSAAMMTRYLGIALFPLFALLVLHRYLVAVPHRRPETAALVVTLPIAPVLGFMYRNNRIDGSLAGLRGEGRFTAYENIKLILGTLDRDLHDIIKVLWIVAALGFVCRLVTRLVRAYSPRRTPWRAEEIIEAYLYGFCVIYLAMLVYAATTADINTLSTRFIEVLYPLFLLQIGLGARQLWMRRRCIVQTGGAALVALCLIAVPVADAGQVRAYFYAVHRPKVANRSYRDIGFDHSKTATRLSAYIDECSKTDDVVHFSGFYNRRSHRPIAMFGLFMRFGVIGRPADDLRISLHPGQADPHSRRFLNNRNEFTMTFRRHGKNRKLVFWNPKRAHRIDLMVRSIDRLMTSHHLTALHFMVVTAYRTRAAFDFDKRIETFPLPRGLERAPITRCGSISIHRFSRDRSD